MSVSQANPTPGAPKKTDDKSFFDVSYFYLANSALFIIDDISILFNVSISCVRIEELTTFPLVI